MPNLDPLPFRSDLQLPTGFRPVQTQDVSLGRYSVGQQSPGPVYKTPKVQPKIADTSTARNLAQLSDAVIKGTITGKKIWDATKDARDQEDFEAIDEFVSGLTAEQALLWAKKGQEGLDAAVRSEEISGLQNPENFKRLWEGVGEKASISLMAELNKDPRHRTQARDSVLEKRGTPGQYLTDVFDDMTKDLNPEVRAGIVSSRTFQQLQAEWIEGAYREAENKVEQEIVTGSVAEVALGLNAGDFTGVEQALAKTRGIRSSGVKLEQTILSEALLSVADADPERALALLGQLSEKGSGVTLGTVETGHESFASYRSNLQAELQRKADRKEAQDEKAQAKLIKEARNWTAPYDLVIQKYVSEGDSTKAEEVLKLTMDAIRNDDSIDPVVRRERIQSLRDNYNQAINSQSLSRSFTQGEKNRKLQADREAFQWNTLAVMRGEQTLDEFQESLVSLDDPELQARGMDFVRKAKAVPGNVWSDNREFIGNHVQLAQNAFLDNWKLDPANAQYRIYDIVTGKEAWDIPEEVQAQALNAGLDARLKLTDALYNVSVKPDASDAEINQAYTKALMDAASSATGVQPGETGDLPRDHASKMLSAEEAQKEKDAQLTAKAKIDLKAQYSEILRDIKEASKVRRSLLPTNALRKPLGSQFVPRYPGVLTRKSVWGKAMEASNKAMRDYVNTPEYRETGVFPLDMYPARDLYLDPEFGAIPVLRNSEDTEVRLDSFSKGSEYARGVLQDMASILSGEERSFQYTRRTKGRYGDTPPRVSLGLDPATKEQAEQEYSEIQRVFYAPSVENLQSGTDDFGRPLNDRPLSERRILSFDIQQTKAQFEEELNAKASILGVTPAQLLKEQSRFYGYYILDNPHSPEIKDNPEAKLQRVQAIEAFDLSKLFN